MQGEGLGTEEGHRWQNQWDSNKVCGLGGKKRTTVNLLVLINASGYEDVTMKGKLAEGSRAFCTVLGLQFQK